MSKFTANRPLTREWVHDAHQRIKSDIHETPVLSSHALSAIVSTPQTPEALIGTQHEGQTPAAPRINLWFKCENQQRVGAFKARGAFHALSRLFAGELEGGVITHSSGNHAAALALAARTKGVQAHIVMPSISTPSKISATKSYGAKVYFSGSTAPEREAVVAEIMKTTDAVLVPPYDHVDIILGQGTAALEFEGQVKAAIAGSGLPSGYPESRGRTGEGLDAVLVPCGGGGLLSGTAVALHGTGIDVFGAEPTKDGADDCRRGLAMNPPRRITEVKTLTIADGVRTPVGEIPWDIISDKTKVRAVYGVSEEQIVEAMRLIFERLKVTVEPSSALPFAVVLFDEDFRLWVQKQCDAGGEDAVLNVGIILSGGNTTMEALAALYSSSEHTAERHEGTLGMHGERIAENVAG